MPPAYFPLRWESTGDQWWFVSPIDWAAANGHYDVVRELLHIDTNLLIKLTSLARIRRLETVWDDEKPSDVAQCRAGVARKLFLECEIESKKGQNSLIRAGYGGWLLYTAASAGDLGFVKELLDRVPLLVFGEGEYGATDVLYAAARSGNCDVFRLVLDYCVSPRGIGEEVSVGFRSEMKNRAVHAAARGGCLEMLEELLGDGGDVLGYRDARGSTLLHTASARGQIQVVKHLISAYDIINSVDNRGNTALNVAAYRGHLSVVELLTSTSPSLPLSQNNNGDTFLHMAVSGFLAPGFKRLDPQLHLMKQLVGGSLINIEDIVNIKNSQGRTALHMAVADGIPSNVVDLLMSVRYIDVNIRDADGNTPLDLLKQRPRSASAEILIKRLIAAGGISNCQDQTTRSALVSHLRRHGIGGSPGTSFRIPDAEILLYTRIEDVGPSSIDFTTTDCGYSGEIEAESNSSKHNKLASTNSATKRFKNLLRLPGKTKEERDGGESELEDDSSVGSYRTHSLTKNSPIPLRQQFLRASSLQNNKRIQSLPANYPPSPSTKKKFAAGLTQGVLRVLPKTYFGSPSSAFSDRSPWSSPASADRTKSATQSPNSDSLRKKRSFNLRMMNNYLCFGAQGLAVDKPMNSPGKKSPNEPSLVV